MKKSEGLRLCDFKPYYKATAMKTVWHRDKDRHIAWHRDKDRQTYRSGGENGESPEVDSSTYSYMSFTRCWENWVLTCKRKKLGPFLTSSTKINSKWTKHPHGRPKTMNLLEEIMEGRQSRCQLWQGFLFISFLLFCYHIFVVLGVHRDVYQSSYNLS
jgi:hypothetical protein